MKTEREKLKAIDVCRNPACAHQMNWLIARVKALDFELSDAKNLLADISGKSHAQVLNINELLTK